MTEDDFWSLIDRHVDSGSGDAPAVAALEDALSQLSPEDIVSFDEIFRRLHAASYCWPLWGAAYLINGGCSDDGFDYFRGWLIAQGRSTYESALRDPDSLVEVAEEDLECEDILYSASKAYEAATGLEEMPGAPRRYPELGEGWDFDDDQEMRARYPRLFSRFIRS